MADRSVSWTDAEKLAQLLTRVSVGKQSAGKQGTGRRTGGSGFGGARSADTRVQPVPVITPAKVKPAESQPPEPKSAEIRAPHAPLRESAAPEPRVQEVSAARSPDVNQVPRLQQTSDNPSDRLDALVAWTLDYHRCTGAFVADDNGLTLAAHGISEAHVSLVGPLLSALIGIRTIPGVDGTAGALWLGANMMSWVEVHTARGGFCLGTVGPEALSTRALEQLKEALEVTVRGL